MATIKEQLIDLFLNKIKNCESKEDFEQLSSELKELFLQSWSETPDNKETSAHLSIGQVKNEYTKALESGLIMESQNALLSDILYHAFGDSEIPNDVKKQYPTLTQEEWNQTLRISQFVLSLFEHDQKQK